jgi:peptidyl-prolyl cis-trans isomerase C
LIGDTKITVSDFNERVSNLPARYQELVRRRKSAYILELINDTLLYQEALRNNLHKDREVQKVVEEARKKILIARLLKDRVDDTITISDEEIKIFYDANADKYMTAEIMRVSHILVPSREEAKNILAELKGGENFEDLARAKSVDPTAQQGGDIGYFPKGQLMSEFEDACGRLDIDEISNVVKTKLGYHVIKLTDRKKPKQRPIEQVSDNIRAQIYTTKRQEIFNELLDRLRKETVIEVNEEALSVSDEDKGENKGEG